jgi:hypothetical protein
MRRGIRRARGIASRPGHDEDDAVAAAGHVPTAARAASAAGAAASHVGRHRRGVLLTGAWMPESQEGPGGSYLSPAYRELLRIHQLARRADEAEKAYQEGVACICQCR